MGLLLKLVIGEADACTFDSVQCRVTLRNDGNDALRLPPLDGLGDALSLEIYDKEGTLLRRDSALTQQRLCRSDPRSSEPLLITVKPGQELRHTVDLACLHLPLAVGSFDVVACFDAPEAAVHLRSETCPIEIREAVLDAVTILRDNPIFDALTFLFRSGEGPDSRYFLRLHGRKRPLAARYVGRILNGAPVQDVFCATMASFASDSFDHFYQRWVLWRQGRTLHAQAFDRGQPISESAKSAEIPRGMRILPFAYCEGNEGLFVLGYDEYGVLCSQAFGESGLERSFIYHLPRNTEGPPTIGIDGAHIHILSAKRGLSYVKLDHRGSMVTIKTLLKSRLKLHSCRYSAEDGCFKAIFWSGGKGKDLQFQVIYPESGERKCYQIEALDIRGEISEVAFDCDARGRFHYLVSTSRKRLLYFRDGRGPLCLAKDEETYFPDVVASDQAYLGFYGRETGYRFVQFDATRHRPRIVDFDGQGGSPT
jgi:hypothetical protein